MRFHLLSILLLLSTACGAEPTREPATPADAPIPAPTETASSEPPAPAAEPAPAPPNAPPSEPTTAEAERLGPKAPPGLAFVEPTEPYVSGTGKCGSFRIETKMGPEPKLTTVSLFDQNGKLAKEFAPKDALESWHAQWCFDVTGDGVPEMVVTWRTSGAHCCYKHTLISLTTPVKELVTYEAGNGSGHSLNPVNIDGKGPFELVDTDDSLVALGSNAYAFTRFLPVVFSFQNGRYVRSTKRFTDYLKKERSDALGACTEEKCWEDGEYVLGLSLLIGDWDKFKKAQKVSAESVAQLEALRKKLAPRLK